MSDEGQDVKTIVQKLSRHEHTIRSWIKSYAKNGIDGLNSKQPSGRPKIKGCVVEEEVEVMLTKTPRDFGYQEEGWTVRIMLDFFQKKLQVKEDTIRRAQNNIWSIVFKSWQDVLEKGGSWKWGHFHQLYETTAAE